MLAQKRRLSGNARADLKGLSAKVFGCLALDVAETQCRALQAQLDLRLSRGLGRGEGWKFSFGMAGVISGSWRFVR